MARDIKELYKRSIIKTKRKSKAFYSFSIIKLPLEDSFKINLDCATKVKSAKQAV